MQKIPTKMHGVADYVTSAALLTAPLLLNKNGERGIESTVPMVLGAGTLITSLITDYELGAAKVVKMPVHLGIDLASGILLSASPWIFGFSKKAWVPHVAIGLMEIAIALSTETEPYQDTYIDVDDFTDDDDISVEFDELMEELEG